MAIRSFAMPPAIRLKFTIEAIAQQRVVVRIRFQINVPAIPTIAARWPAARHVLLPPESHATVSAIAGFHQNSSFINKHGSLARR